MTHKTFLYDPNNYEIIEDADDVVAAYNASEPHRGYLHITVEDQHELNEMLLDAGQLKEVYIQ